MRERLREGARAERKREVGGKRKTERERLYKNVKISMKYQPYVAAMAVEQCEAQAVAGS